MADTDNRKKVTDRVVGSGGALTDIANKFQNATHDFFGRPKWVDGGNVASAGSISVPDDSNKITVTGTTTITAIAATTVGGTSIQTGVKLLVKFSSTPVLTHNNTSFILPGGDDYYVKTNDILEFEHLGSGNWQCNMITNPVSAGAVDPTRNIIINGDFNIWQRGTSFASPASSTYQADRFELVNNTGVATVTITRSSDVPTLTESEYQSNYSYHLAVTTADTTVDAGDTVGINHDIEGYNIQEIMNRPVTLSFWVKAVKTGTYCVALHNSSNDRSYIIEYTVDTTATWEKKILTFVMDDGATGTWNFTNGKGVEIRWSLMVGTTFQGTANSWTTANTFGTSNQVNAMDSTANTFQLSQIKFAVGTVATDFVSAGNNIQTELALCQRYYSKSYSINTAPGTVTAVGAYYEIAAFTTVVYPYTPFPVKMRTTPTVTFYSPVTGASGKIYESSVGDKTSSAGLVGETSFGSTSASFTAGNLVEYHYTAEAEL